jgi:hypothetical protein
MNRLSFQLAIPTPEKTKKVVRFVPLNPWTNEPLIVAYINVSNKYNNQDESSCNIIGACSFQCIYCYKVRGFLSLACNGEVVLSSLTLSAQNLSCTQS